MFAPTGVVPVLFSRNNSLYVKNESDLVDLFLFLHFSVFAFLAFSSFFNALEDAGFSHNAVISVLF